MPHVSVNRALLMMCLRKRPYKSPEEAADERFDVYQCLFCKKWHRASTLQHKVRRTALIRQQKEAAALEKKRRQQVYRRLRREEEMSV